MNKENEKCTFQILFTSDIHGAFLDYNYASGKETPNSGFSKLATLMRKDKENFSGTTFIVDIGDAIQGNGTNALVGNNDYQPYPLYAAFDALGYDIASIGNHEFNFGFEKLFASLRGYKGTKLCGNVFDSNGKLLPDYKPYTIRTLENGLRIAFIGMVSPNVVLWDMQSFSKNKYVATNAAQETRIIIDAIKSNNLADIIVLLGHMHINNENGMTGSGANDIIAKNPEIDLFLGSHFHMILGTKEQQMVLQDLVKFAENKNAAATYGKVLVTATFQNEKWGIINKTGTYEDSDIKTDIITIPPNVQNDPEVCKSVDKAHKFIKDYMERMVGYLDGGNLVPEPQIPGTHEAILKPTPLIHLIGKIMLTYAKTDIAAVSYNDFAAGHEKGQISNGGIVQMYVYDNNTVYKLSMTGKQILKWMEWSHEYFGSTINGVPDLIGPAINLETDLTIPYGTKKVYLHDKFIGLNYEVDLTKSVGSRIHVRSLSDGRAFNVDDIYTVAVTNYRATTNLLGNYEGGVFPNKGEPFAKLDEMDLTSPFGETNMLDWIKEYITSRPNKTIYNDCAENWCFVNLNWDQELRKKAINLIEENKIFYDFKVPVKKEQIK